MSQKTTFLGVAGGIVLVTALVIAGCGGGSSGPTAPPDPINVSNTNSAISNTDAGIVDDGSGSGSPEQIAGPGVALEKATNGFDADTAPGPSIPEGDPVEWTYVVTNIGDVELVSYLVEDNLEGEICRGSSLAAGESDTCTFQGVAVDGQYANVGTVTASDGSTRVSATDPSHYLGNGGAFTAVQIEKSTNGEDADFPIGPIVLPLAPIDWSYDVTNIGEVELISYLVEDDVEGEICRGSNLAPGATDTCTFQGTAVEGQYENVATVTASNGQIRVSDDDPSHYFGSVPIVEIDKLTDGEEGPTLVEGCPVTWTYDVYNRGNIELARIAVTDSEEGPISCPSGRLAVGEDMRCEQTGIVGPDPYTNTATVLAVDPAGNPAPEATDTDGYRVRQEPPDCSNAAPSIDIIWPANHKMVAVNIVDITDTCGRPFSVTIDGITQDEPLDAEGDGNFEPDGAGVGTDTAELRAERQGTGDGRVYEISFSAENESGVSCSGAVQVGVPHDRNDTPIDSGQNYDSTGG